MPPGRVRFHIPSLPMVDFDTFGEYNVSWRSQFVEGYLLGQIADPIPVEAIFSLKKIKEREAEKNTTTAAGKK